MRDADPAAASALVKEGLGRFREQGESLGVAVALLLLGRPVPPGILDELGEPLLAVMWRRAFGREMPPMARLEGETVLRVSPSSALAQLAHLPDGLTPRQVEVLVLLARHYSDREIAAELILSIRTVERHVANIYAKTVVSSRRLAADYARQHSLLSVG
jgi:DNA-binding CsgD family transcriptional regulator